MTRRTLDTRGSRLPANHRPITAASTPDFLASAAIVISRRPISRKTQRVIWSSTSSEYNAEADSGTAP